MSSCSRVDLSLANCCSYIVLVCYGHVSSKRRVNYERPVADVTDLYTQKVRSKPPLPVVSNVQFYLPRFF